MHKIESRLLIFHIGTERFCTLFTACGYGLPYNFTRCIHDIQYKSVTLLPAIQQDTPAVQIEMRLLALQNTAFQTS